MNAFESTKSFVEALNRLNIPYMIVGSLSSNAYGIERSTRDADIVIETDTEIDAIASAVKNDYQREAQMGFETVGMTTKYVFKSATTLFKIEVFTLSRDAHDRERFARRLRDETDGVTTWFPTAEDVIIQKLRWARRKDKQDIRDVLDVQEGHLDLDYLHAWCERHDTRAVLDEIRAMPPE